MAQPVNSTHMVTDNFEVGFLAHKNVSSPQISERISNIANFLFDSYWCKRVVRAWTHV